MTAAYQRFYNHERPHQGLSCGNLPPRVAFPTLPTLLPVPALVDADRWLQHYDGHSFVRKVRQGGSVTVADVPYYIKASLVGQRVALRVDAQASEFVVDVDGRAVQRLAMQGLGRGVVPFATFVEHVCADSRAPVRRALTLGRARQRAARALGYADRKSQGKRGSETGHRQHPRRGTPQRDHDPSNAPGRIIAADT